MTYTLSVPESCLDRINNLRRNNGAGRTALLLSSIADDGANCAMDVTDFIELESQGGSALLRSPAIMEAIDRAMEHCSAILLLHPEPCTDDSCFDPGTDMANRILFRIAYHYLPSGPHACIACGSRGLLGMVWLKDSTTVPMDIRVC